MPAHPKGACAGAPQPPDQKFSFFIKKKKKLDGGGAPACALWRARVYLITSPLSDYSSQKLQCYRFTVQILAVIYDGAAASSLLVVAYPAQGHINPTLRLAKRLAREASAASASARVTFSTAVSAHRRMFPSSADRGAIHDDGLSLSYIPYSDSFDDGFNSDKHDARDFLNRCILEGSKSLAAIVDDLAACRIPITCFIYPFFMSWVAGVACDRNVPSILYWIQPATAFAAYWHYFHDHESLGGAGSPSCIVNLPSLPPMRIRDLPSFVSAGSQDGPYAVLLPHIRDMFRTLDAEAAARGGRRPQVLANTAEELEAPALASVDDKVDMICIGPVLEVAAERSLIKGVDGYTEWLAKHAERSVVYVSFGSITVLSREQVEEIWRGLREGGRLYLWLIRKDNRWEGMELEDEGKGMVVEWCRQERVLAHVAVGCFVTHCGWNSTVESLMCVVPTVAIVMGEGGVEVRSGAQTRRVVGSKYEDFCGGDCEPLVD